MEVNKGIREDYDINVSLRAVKYACQKPRLYVKLEYSPVWI